MEGTLYLLTYLIESFPKKSNLIVLLSSGVIFLTFKVVTPTVSASSDFFSFPILKAKRSIRKRAVAN